jgi:hypothetical protein
MPLTLAASRDTTEAKGEPRVLTSDVGEILKQATESTADLGAHPSKSVATLAETAGTSTRTVYRVLSGSTDTISLDLADRLCLAANSHVSQCRVKWPDGRVEPYLC